MASASPHNATPSAEPSPRSSPEAASRTARPAADNTAKVNSSDETFNWQDESASAEEVGSEEDDGAHEADNEQPGQQHITGEVMKQEASDEDEGTRNGKNRASTATDTDEEDRQSGSEDRDETEQEDKVDERDESELEAEKDRYSDTAEAAKDREGSEREVSEDQAEGRTSLPRRTSTETESEKGVASREASPELREASNEPSENEGMLDDDAAGDVPSEADEQDVDMSDHSEADYVPARQHEPDQDDELPLSFMETLQAEVRSGQNVPSSSKSAPATERGHRFWKKVDDSLPVDYDRSYAAASAVPLVPDILADVDRDDSDVDAEKKYRHAQQEMDRKRKRGKVSQGDEFELIRLKQKHDNAMRRARTQQEHEAYDAVGQEESEDDELLEGSSLFVPMQEQHDGQPAPKKQKTARKPAVRKPRAKPVAGAPKVQKARAKKPSAAELKRQHEANVITNLTGGGLNTNLFDNVQANTGREEQPTFTAPRRPDALKQILASIPDNQKQAAIADKDLMIKHLKYFTPNGSCKSDGQGSWKMTGLLASLSNYQMIGVGWMRKQETESDGNENAVPGGLIADAMGLGKTVMCIANIVNGRPRNKKECKTTLIVVPNSLISQWHSEIQKHAKYVPGGNNQGIKHVGLHCSKQRLTNLDTTPEAVITMFMKFDIILTTYTEVCREFPKFRPPPELRTKEEKAKWWSHRCNEDPGPLHSMTFHRVVLDEATAIKNYMSDTSIACRAIKAKYRWAISGTPAQNHTAEFYPYFKFLRVPNTGSFRIFKQNYCDPDNGQARERLYHFLRTFMLKRTHADTFLGSKLLPLPKPTQNTSHLYFTKVESEIYDIVHRRFVDRINGFSKSGQLRKKYGHVLAMITRLRQLTCHPLLIQDTMRDLLEPEDFRALRELAARPVPEYEHQAAVLSHLRRMLATKPEDLEVVESDTITRQAQKSNSNGSTDGAAQDASSDSAPTANPAQLSTGKAFAKADSTHLFLAEIESQQPIYEQKTIYCPHCKKAVERPVHMNCGHSYCYRCTLIMSISALDASQDGQSRCLVCKTAIVATDNGEVHTTVPSPQKDAKTTAKGGKKGKKMSTTDIVDSWVDAEGNMVPSTKTTAVKAQILAWKEEQPGVKIIIYTQFLTMVRILDKMCKIEGWGCCQLHGSMDCGSRDRSIRGFGENRDTNILISTLRSGGVGLNLVMASRVLMIDLWWNSSVEHQAFCRAYRRGQKAETVMRRLAIRDTVDKAIVDMQERKDAEIRAVMDDDEQKKVTTEELLQLFGTVKNDANGNPYVVVDEDRSRHKEVLHIIDDDDMSGDES